MNQRQWQGGSGVAIDRGGGSGAPPQGSSSQMLTNMSDPIQFQYDKGEMVVVRCNQHKWLLGEVTQITSRGVKVWVGEAGLSVNVPKQLLASHILKMSVVEGLHALPTGGDSMVSSTTVDPNDPSRCLFQCVRPAHLSHRQLYISTPQDVCAVCKEKIINEDDGIEPWDCSHHCHFDCVQNQPSFFSTSSCPTCSEEAAAAAAAQVASTTVLSVSKLRTIDENALDLSAPIKKIQQDQQEIKPLEERKGQDTPILSASSAPDSSPASEKTQEDAKGSKDNTGPKQRVSSLADRMKKLKMAKAADQQGAEKTETLAAGSQMEQGPWVTVIKDRQDTRQIGDLERMAKAKENTLASKAAKGAT